MVDYHDWDSFGWSYGGLYKDEGGDEVKKYWSGWAGNSTTTFGEKKIDLPAPLFMNNYFLVKFTCKTCGKTYSTFSARPDVEVSCVFCRGNGAIEVTEVCDEFVLKDGLSVCQNCSLAVDAGGADPVFCPKCGGSYAKLEKGHEENPSS